MAEPRRILVVTSCTSLKLGTTDPVRAERLYLGEQHRRLMRGIECLRRANGDIEVDLRILSAGLGLISGDAPVTTYDECFSGLARTEIDKRAASLGIPEDLGMALRASPRLSILLLGDDYMRAAALDQESYIPGPTIAFGGAGLARRLGGHPSVSVVPATKMEARRFGCGLVGLKGELGGRLLELLAERPDLLATVASWPGSATLDALESLGMGAAVAA